MRVREWNFVNCIYIQIELLNPGVVFIDHAGCFCFRVLEVLMEVGGRYMAWEI